MKKASRLLATGLASGGVIGDLCTGVGLTLSLVHVDHHATAYFSLEDFWGECGQVGKRRLAHRGVELVERQVGAEAPPRLLARCLGQHHRVDAVDRNATQDE